MNGRNIKLSDIHKDIQKLKNAGWFGELEDNKIVELFDIKYKNNRTKQELSIFDCIDAENICPNNENIFNAFKINESKEVIIPEDIRVLVLGQDPYPEKTKAHGYSFSVPRSYTENHGIDASLANIFKAISKYNNEEYNEDKYKNYTDLSKWAENNKVLLLNTALTYNKLDSLTNRRNAWKPFIETVINNLVNKSEKLAVFLWGTHAQQLFFNCIKKPLDKKTLYKNKIKIICNERIKVFMTSHPSPQGVYNGFDAHAHEHFKACDEFLFENEKEDKKNYIWLNFPENNQ